MPIIGTESLERLTTEAGKTLVTEDYIELSPEADLRAKVLADPAVAELVGARMYPLILAQKCPFPALVYSILNTPIERSLDGPSGLVHPGFQIECYAEIHAGARTLADAVRVLLDGFSGVLEGDTVIQWIRCLDDRDRFGEETPVYCTVLDFEVWIEE
jgi:hypothetical protein